MSKCQIISVSEYQKLCENNQVKLIDIRREDEHTKEHIEGAQNKQLNDLNKNSFTNDEIVVFHCQSGNRTRQAEDILKQLGLENIYILEGGINAWKKAKLQTVVNTEAPFPIMRQVQIVVGLMVLLGIILSYTVSPLFNLLSAFFGAGLLFAGLTGSCALANALMLLPFNKPKK
ncbi:rhodanese family protein [Thiotrichales bacterium 19S11-10]|nr:rhodanese family protein [Thiotrichales bacterium 19S11-10]MCF6808183.1 rhodanese family protein [Thiotrichales bacterium 19S9-11]MCF6812199.1 rhodanese family protein [Thiotrichales bacterium 19S9-12]